jgi:hypothetical protein
MELQEASPLTCGCGMTAVGTAPQKGATPCSNQNCGQYVKGSLLKRLLMKVMKG